ncbi:TonB-dependent SusC/RagA subfamily outer membrane receptor [Pedobacter sp. UYP30]|uniref:alpha-2-macroglobulin family protein n=1 Tax=Pedobacter sp. UYP30 TaxID=1756400 RepID=UPI0033990F8D
MKLPLSLIACLFVFSQSLAQKRLSRSRQSSLYTYIYKLTDQEAFDVSASTKADIGDSYYHTVIDSFYTSKGYRKELGFGHYLYVYVGRNKLYHTLKSVQNVDIQFVNNLKDFQFYITDSKGNLIQDAKVEIGKNKEIHFDSQAKLYSSSYPKKEEVIKVSYQGLISLFKFDLEDQRYNYRQDWPVFKKIVYSFPVKYLWQPVKTLFQNKNRNRKSKYTGYMVFSKPKYKPLDTVKFKAYILKKNGKLIFDKEALVNIFINNKPKTLTNLKPYKDGGYEYSFVLADSLNLRLDRSYSVSLVDKNTDLSMISGAFTYEDYELKALNFAVRTDKELHQIGDPIAVFFKATDENELAVPDGRVEITALTKHVAAFYKDKVFVPDTLWTKNINLEPIGETKLILPDSIFPKADLNFTLDLKFLNSNNESRAESKYLRFKYNEDKGFLKQIIGSLKKDSLLIDYRVNDKSEKQQASVSWYSKESVLIDSQVVFLPTTLKTDYRAAYYEVKTMQGFKEGIYLANFKPNLFIVSNQSKDSLHVQVNNENKVPFWYTVFSGNRVFFKGYTKTLDTIFRHSGNKAAHIRINYFWDEEEKVEEISTFYAPNILNVKLIAPEVVYPGQKVNMLVKVTDVNNKPVGQTDLTAYAFTSKFKNNYTPYIPSFTKGFYARKQKVKIETDYINVNSSSRLNWLKWGKAVGLDTIEYYKFTHPNSVYSILEDSNDTITQVAPFAVSNGEIEPVQILYIDDVPVFFNQANQLQRYAFGIKPGLHSLRLRTQNYMITLQNYHFEKGKKAIISILVDVKNDKAAVVVEPSKLSVYEAELINNYMFKVTDNFNGEKTLISTGDDKLLLNPPPNVLNNKDLIIGPIKENYLNFKSGDFKQEFTKEPGYTYTFTPGLIKQKSYKSNYAFDADLKTGSNTTNLDFTQNLLKKGEIDSIWTNYLNLRSYSTELFTNSSPHNANTTGQLEFKIDTAFSNSLPYIKNIIVYKPNDPSFLQIYPGNNTQRLVFDKGEYFIRFLLKDNRYFTAKSVNILAKGINYYKWDSFKIQPADELSLKLDDYIKSVKKDGYYGRLEPIDLSVLEKFNQQNFDVSGLKNIMTGRIIDQKSKLPLQGVTVKIVGLSKSVVTNSQGVFSLNVPEFGELLIAYIGFKLKNVKILDGNVGDIALEEDDLSLNEVVVVGYSSMRKQSLTASVTTLSSLQGRVAGVNISTSVLKIRGMGSLPSGEKPLIIVDGIPYTGDINTLSPDDIVEINVLSPADATAIYGATGAKGVIIVKTKKGNVAVNSTGELVSQQQTMRTNFSDEGFWQPKLITDETGAAKFSVKFPDDITSWKTRVIAMNGRKQGGFTETLIKSFKSLSANFVSPLFAVDGDKINVIGKLMNYTPFEESVNRTFTYNGTELRNSDIKFKNSHIDTVSIDVTGQDSLNFKYTLQQENGYFDGEIRKIPVFEQGIKETKGYFSAMIGDTSITYSFDKNLGKVTVRAESSIFPTLLDEMTKLRNYEYLCNEQLASKLKSLLLEKQIRKYLNQPFNHEKDIAFVVKKLQHNRKPQGTWAWWQNGDEQIWISLHVVEALLQAEKSGYKIDLNKQVLYTYLVGKLVDQPNNYNQIQTIKLLHLLNDKYYVKDWILASEKRKTKVKPALFEQLEMMELKQVAGIKLNIDSLLAIRKHTMFGNSYWGEESERFWDNSIQNTLLAYRILKNAGGYQKELEKITLYFLEQRKDGQWRNTFESSSILEAILPEMLAANTKAEPATLNLNSEVITAFPYDKVLENTSEIKLDKKGNMPIYFTAYQQFQNPKPKKVSKDFSVNTSFIQNGTTTAKLKAGTLTTLKVEVDVRADADYVMIEIPIPAGCSYENKTQQFWGIETHREYFKNKTSIFCEKLKQGKYVFNIDLMTRYSGLYVLNPAKAEMMYFPVFYGREEMKKVGIN